MKRFLSVIIILLLLITAAAEEMLAASGAHALYLDGNGCVWAWGSNQKGESDPESGEQRVPAPRKVFENTAYIACGRQFSARIDKAGLLSFWGKSYAEMTVPDAVQVSACEDICAYVLKDGSAYIVNGDGTEKVFDEGIVSTACGYDFALFLSDDGKCYRREAETELLMENVTAIAANGQTGMLISEGLVYVFGASGSEGRLGLDTAEWLTSPVSNGVCAAALAPGVAFSGAVDENGQLYVWGAVYSYMTAFDENGDPVASLADGYLINYGKTPVGLYTNVKCAAIGDAFAAVLLNDGYLMTWGSNDQGQCGDGYFTACEASLDADDDDGERWEVTMTDNEQRIFPMYIKVN